MRARPTLCLPVGKHEHLIGLDFYDHCFPFAEGIRQRRQSFLFLFFPFAKGVSHLKKKKSVRKRRQSFFSIRKSRQSFFSIRRRRQSFSSIRRRRYTVTKTATDGLHTRLWPSAFHHFHVSWTFVRTAISCLYRIVYIDIYICIVLPRWTVYSFYVFMILFNMFFAFSCLVPPPPQAPRPTPHHHPNPAPHPAPLLFFPTQQCESKAHKGWGKKTRKRKEKTRKKQLLHQLNPHPPPTS